MFNTNNFIFKVYIKPKNTVFITPSPIILTEELK